MFINNLISLFFLDEKLSENPNIRYIHTVKTDHEKLS